jgi:hypothetical protein
VSLEEDLQFLELKLKALKRDYEQYFTGNRPREPAYDRSEVQKMLAQYGSTPIKNTALRFKYNTINARFQAFKRQWDTTLRQIDQGTYRRHVFRAKLHEQDRADDTATRSRAAAAPPEAGGDLFDAYRKAAASCGQDVAKLSREKLDRVIRQQEEQIRAKTGCRRVDFRVVVQDGKVKLKAAPVKS